MWYMVIKHSERAVRNSYVVRSNDGSENPYLQQEMCHTSVHICGFSQA
jgi:hypothetical protein